MNILEQDFETIGIMAEDYQNYLVESLDSSGVDVVPALHDKWTDNKQYFLCSTGRTGSEEVILIRLQNKWHKAGGRIGKRAKTLTIHEAAQDKDGNLTIKPLKRVKYPFGMLSGIIAAMKLSFYETHTDGFLVFLEPKLARYVKLIKRVVQKDKFIKAKFDLNIHKIGGDNVSGVMITLVSAIKSPEQVFSNLYKRYEKLGVDVTSLDSIASSDIFSDEAKTQVKTSLSKSKSLKLDMSFFMTGDTKSYNKDLRGREALEPKVNKEWVVQTQDKTKQAIIDLVETRSEKKGWPANEGESKVLASRVYTQFLTDKYVELNPIQTPDFTQNERYKRATAKFTGSAYDDSRAVLLGEWGEDLYKDSLSLQRRAEEITEIVSAMDAMFDDYGHNLAGYTGYAYRGMNLDNKYKVLKEYIVNQNHAFPSHTSFTFQVSTGNQFGRFPDWSTRWLESNGDYNPPNTVEALAVNGSESIFLFEKLEEMFGDDAFENKKHRTTNGTTGKRIGKCRFFMYSTGGHDDVNVIIPGAVSNFQSEAELIVERGTKTTTEKIACFVVDGADGYGSEKGTLDVYILMGLTFVSTSNVVAESSIKGFKEKMMTEAKKKPKDKGKKPKFELKKVKRPNYTPAEIEELEKKFGGECF